MSTCKSCGQEMPKVDNPFDLAALRKAIMDIDISWEYVSVGENIYIDQMPIGASVRVIAEETESEYDSYGDAVGSGYVVFQVSFNGQEKNFKVEGSQSSYGGWEWEERYITEVAASPKTVVLWEAIK